MAHFITVKNGLTTLAQELLILLPDGVNPADGFHTYAIEWQEGEIRWYVDDYLYATQRKSEVRTNSRDEAVGLSHRGWFTENFDNVTGELTTFWENAPFDQEVLSYS